MHAPDRPGEGEQGSVFVPLEADHPVEQDRGFDEDPPVERSGAQGAEPGRANLALIDFLRSTRSPYHMDADGRERDPFDRLVPSRLNWVKLSRAVPGLMAQFNTRVPDQFFAFEVEDGTAVAVIACPCGEEPKVPIGSCTECTCERFYLATATSARVANSPVHRESDASTDAPAE